MVACGEVMDDAYILLELHVKSCCCQTLTRKIPMLCSLKMLLLSAMMLKVLLVLTYVVDAWKEYLYVVYGVVIQEIDMSLVLEDCVSSYKWKESVDLDDMRSRA